MTGRQLPPFALIRAKRAGKWSWHCNRPGCDAYRTGIADEPTAQFLATRHQSTKHKGA